MWTKHHRDTLEAKVERLAIKKNNWNNCTKKSLFSLFKQRSCQQISKLKTSNQVPTNELPEMIRHTENFFEKFYGTPTIETAAYETPPIPNERKFKENDKLQSQFTKEEVIEAIKSLPNCRSPGLDGLTNEFYKAFAGTIATLLTNSYNALPNGETTPEEFSLGTVVLIFKKGDPELLENYRPITLLNCDSKILTKVISWRLRTSIGRIIGPFQYGFTPGRKSEDNAMTLQLSIAHLNKNRKSESGLLFLDMEKAYDRIVHEWLFYCLRMIHFPPLLLDVIKRL